MKYTKLNTPVKTTPAIIPKISPNRSPERRLDPDTLCPQQKERVVRRILP